MPQLAPAFLVAIAGEGGAALIMTAIAKTVIAVGLSAAYTKYQQRQLKQNLKAGPKEVVIRDTTQPQIVVYGETFVGGVICYMNTVHPGVNQGHELHMAIAVAGHEIEDVTDIYLDDTLLEDGGALDWTANAVVSGIYDPDSRTDCEAVKVWKHLGTSTQTVDTELNTHYSADWTSDYRLRGIAYVVFRFKLTEKSESLWAGGPPQSIRLKVKGKKVYDPRLDTSPGANPSTSTYIAWSENPILCAADYMRSFMGVAAARFDWDWIADQADICDALVIVPPSASPSNYEKRYTCNGALSLGETHGRNISDILSSCIGRLSKVNGKWRITAGAYETPSITLTDDDIIGPVVMSTSLSRSERFNTVRGVFGSDSSNKYREMEFKQVTSATYVTRDNGETISRSISLPMTTSDYMAQRIGIKMLNQGNQQTTVTLPVRWTGLKVAVGSGVNLTLSKFGWSSKVFRCVGWKMGGGDSPFELVLKEDSSSAWSDPAVGDYTTVTATGAVTLPDEDVAKGNAPFPLSNMLPIGYSNHEKTTIDQYAVIGSGSIALDTAQKYSGAQSLKVTGVTGNGSTWGVEFAYSFRVAGNLFLPPSRRWAVVAALRANQYAANSGLKFALEPDIGSAIVADSAQTLTQDTWVQRCYIIDATSSTDTQFILEASQTNSGLLLGTPIVHIDEVRLFDVTDQALITAENFPTAIVPSTLVIEATSTQLGQVRLATDAEAVAGSSSAVALTPANLGSVLTQSKVKDADTARTSTTTLADDADLAGFDVAAATEYLLEAELRVTTANDTPDFKYTWQFSQTPQQASGFLVDEGGTGVTDGTASSITLTSTSTRNASGGADFVLRVSARILGHATTAGTMDFQWAQDTSSANATTLKAGSWMRLSPTT